MKVFMGDSTRASIQASLSSGRLDIPTTVSMDLLDIRIMATGLIGHLPIRIRLIPIRLIPIPPTPILRRIPGRDRTWITPISRSATWKS